MCNIKNYLMKVLNRNLAVAVANYKHETQVTTSIKVAD